MKKKALSLVLILTFVMMYGITAFAASPTVQTVMAPAAGQTAVTAVNDTGTPAYYAQTTTVSQGFTVRPVSQQTAMAARVAVQNYLLNNLEALGTMLGDHAIVVAAKTPGAVVGAAILSTVEVSSVYALKDANGMYNVGLNNPLIAAGDELVILHYNGAYWEVIKPTLVVNGAVSFQTATLSPVTIVKVSSTSVAPPQAPKTGAGIPVMAIMLVVCACVTVISGRKYFAR